MNHQDIARLLIGRGISRLTDAGLSEVQQHLASCHDCASDWDIHARLMAQPVPPMSALLAARCRAAVAAQPRPHGNGKRKSSRYILIGTALVVAAAAAMLALRLAKSDRPPAGPADPVITEPRSADPKNEVRVPVKGDAAPVEDSPAEADASHAPQEFTVQVMPLVYEARDPAGRDTAQKYYAALIDQLRAVSGLKLIGPDPSAIPTEVEPDFRITVTGEEPLIVTIPGVIRQETGPPWSAVLRVYSRREDGSMGFMLSITTSSITCSLSITRSGGNCDAAWLATRQIETLRLWAFPPDPSLPGLLEAKLGNPALPAQVRRDALRMLLKSERKPADWDAAAIRGAVDLATKVSDPRTRMETWKMLRGVKHPDLVQPLLEQLHGETDGDVRLAAVTTLTADFSAAPAVLSALESLVNNEKLEMVSEVARRALFGDESWRRFVLTRLKDARLTAEQRIEPLIYMSQKSPYSETARVEQDRDLMALLDDAEILTQLLQVLPMTGNSPRDRSGSTGDVTQLLDTLGAVRHPAATDILLDVLRNNPDQSAREMAADELGRRDPSDARVLKELERAAAEDPDPTVRQAAERARSPGVEKWKL